MFAKLKHLFQLEKTPGKPENENSEEAETLHSEIMQLESGLKKNPADTTIQKRLMVKYTQAVKVFSAAKPYRHQVDDIFLRMDELRNTIRKNI
ncbi:hypothetical protein ACLEEB_02810 [Lonsdalea quercina]|uniref:Uncharacterized protein n=1 Tax=Lonsdalea quercina TaxID=71657 RepID=A0A1H4D4L1_9GAMM|nr:hypothetical protein [Lonsdalea quercina]SEA67440.1 hypothetical protein SAMN02982996_02157 [Lonsdalea quercina]